MPRAEVVIALAPMLPTNLIPAALGAARAGTDVVPSLSEVLTSAEGDHPVDARSELDVALFELLLQGAAQVGRDTVLSALSSSAVCLSRVGGRAAFDATLESAREIATWLP